MIWIRTDPEDRNNANKSRWLNQAFHTVKSNAEIILKQEGIPWGCSPLWQEVRHSKSSSYHGVRSQWSGSRKTSTPACASRLLLLPLAPPPQASPPSCWSSMRDSSGDLTQGLAHTTLSAPGLWDTVLLSRPKESKTPGVWSTGSIAVYTGFSFHCPSVHWLCSPVRAALPPRRELY